MGRVKMSTWKVAMAAGLAYQTSEASSTAESLMFYQADLSYIHHVGFGSFSEQAAPWLIALFHRAGIKPGLIVDLACGSGIWAAQAAEAGFDVLGIDISPAMIELARAHAPQASFMVGSIHEAAIPACVAVTALGEGISYLSADAEDVDLAHLVSRVAEALAPGGVFVFDVVERQPDALMNYVSSREGADWKVSVEVHEDPRRRMLTRTIHTSRTVGSETRQTMETHRLRVFDRNEILDALESAGLEASTTRAYGQVEIPSRRLGFIAYNQRRLTTRCNRQTVHTASNSHS
jgi:SAM-dependent methyltransferase